MGSDFRQKSGGVGRAQASEGGSGRQKDKEQKLWGGPAACTRVPRLLVGSGPPVSSERDRTGQWGLPGAWESQPDVPEPTGCSDEC